MVTEMKEHMKNETSPAAICEKTRRLASEAFLAVIQQVWGTSFSELQLKDLWLQELRKNENLFPSGWYTSQPPKGPPDGIGVLIGDEKKPGRLNYQSLRPSENHPQADIYFNHQTGLAYVYASPVDRETGTIGDWGMTFYAGKNSDIFEHLRRVYSINCQIAKVIRPGKKVSDVYQEACAIFKDEKLTNNVTSVTDPLGINIGHSVPGTLEPYSEKKLATIKGDDWFAACKVISDERVFFNGTVDYVFKPGDCFTMEPRLTDLNEPNLPMVSFHTIIRITEDGARLLENFAPIFQETGMNYLQTHS
jgi:hypothetical protein